jgi:ubiquitin-conjugating enzyme E2 variant
MPSTSAPAWNHSTPQKFVFQLFCLLGALTLVGLTTREAIAAAQTWLDASAMVLGAVGGLLLADLASGLVHWAADTYGTEQTPLVGQLFVKLFRVHHSDPDNITRTGFVRINGDNSMLAALFMLGMLGLRELGIGPTRPWALAMLAAFSVAIAFTNLLHQWAHRNDPPALARLLHRLGLVLTPAAHARHHEAPHLSDYCITFGWLNPVLDRLDMFRRMERGLAAVGIHPTRDASDVLPQPQGS